MTQPSFFRTLFGDSQTRARLVFIYCGLIGFYIVAWVWAFAEFSG